MFIPTAVPTSPTDIPTVLVSVPTFAPFSFSVAPTLEYPPLSNARPLLELSVLGSAYSVSQFTPGLGNLGNSISELSFTNTVIDLTGSSSISYSIGELLLPAGTSINFVYPSPAHIAGILKTPIVYSSTENSANTVYVVYSITDAFGRTQCSPEGIAISLTVGSTSSACSIFASPLSPFSTCMLEIDSVLFSTSITTLPVSLSLSLHSTIIQNTAVGSVLLAAVPTQSTPTAVGMYFQMPIYEAVPGDIISVQLWAQTASSSMTMESWGFSLVYDNLLLTFVDIAHPLYTTVVTNTAIFNALNATGSGGNGGITGWFLAATVSFLVLPTAAGTTIQISMPAILSNSMTNSVPITYNNNFAGHFADSRGGWSFLSGQMGVINPVIAGLYAYSATSSFVNTFTLNGIISRDSMTVMATYSTGRSYSAYADTQIQPSSCQSSDPTVFSTVSSSSGCLVTLAQNGGGSSISITASFNGFNVVVSYRAYYFMGYSINASRTSLRALGCDFETAYLTAFAGVTLDGVSSVATVDLSESLIFTSSDSSVVSISGHVASGVKAGTATVSFSGSTSSCVLTVINTVASVVNLFSYAYTSIEVMPSSTLVAEHSYVRLLAQPALSLNAELQSAAIVSYALDDDGVWTDVSRYSTLLLSSTDLSNIDVSKSGADWQLFVPIGASSVNGTVPVISGILRDSCGTALFQSGIGYANTNLSIPVAITVTASSSFIARPFTPAATSLGIPTSTQLTVMVTFRSSVGALSYKDFTTDARTLISINFINSTGTLSSNAVVSLISSSGINSAGSVIIRVTTPSYNAASALSGELTLVVVDVDTSVPLGGNLVHSITPLVPVNFLTPLSPISCSGMYQNGSLDTVLVTLTDGSTAIGTPSLLSSNMTVAKVSGTTIVALSEGVSTIIASYASASGYFTAIVRSTPVSISAISLSYSSSTLSGPKGATAAASVSVSLSDGTSFIDAVSSLAFLSILIGFSSSDPDSVSISSSGTAYLVNNSWQYATLSAFSQCGDGNLGTFNMAGNLVPTLYDTKLGLMTGLTFPPVSFTETVDVSIHVQIASSPLATYQVFRFYDLHCVQIRNSPIFVCSQN